MQDSNNENLEVFNNPPSKYEANGSGGLININTKAKNSDTQGGSLSLTSGYGKGEKTGVSSNFHYQHCKIGIHGSYSIDRNRSPEEWGLETELDNQMIQKASNHCAQLLYWSKLCRSKKHIHWWYTKWLQ